ncbi:MAG: D-alanine--D-alanine ligase [Nitrospirota bacterium]|nr:D-alanine--D-alanine ligase [Nitrospirota bacterium]
MERITREILQQKGLRRVAVLRGGESDEAAVSRVSAKAVSSALKEEGFEVEELEADRTLAATLSAFSPDVAFLATHGGGGENGSLQGFLETMKIPYTGSGVLGSAIGMSKMRSRALFRERGLAVPLTYAHMSGHPFKTESISFDPPYMVKPESAGSSIGIMRVGERTGLSDAVNEAGKYSRWVLVEQNISGREIQSAVLDDRFIGAIEVIPEISEPFYTYNSKYAPGGSRHICPAPLSETLLEELAAATLEAHRILELRGCSRLDTILGEDGTFVILEINTLPGLTPTSLVPEIARTAGLSFKDLLMSLLGTAQLDSDRAPAFSFR